MKCALCGETATVFLRRRAQGASLDQALCERCARGRGLSVRDGRVEIAFDDLVSGPAGEGSAQGTCPDCGTERGRLARTGRLGCPTCLPTFRETLASLLPRGRGALEPAGDGPPPEARAPHAAIIHSRLSVGRNFPALPFPEGAGGAKTGTAAAARALRAAGLEVLPLSEAREDERAFLDSASIPASWLSDPSSTLGRTGSPDILCLCDLDDHLSLRGLRKGLAVLALAREAGAIASALGRSTAFLRDEEFGFITSKVVSFGSGVSASILLHLPALGRSGRLDRHLRALLAEGWCLEGSYGYSEGSAGDLWILSASADGPQDPASLEAAALRLSEAEDEARAALPRGDRVGLLDSLGRALGTIRYAWRIGGAEALDLLSELRLGSLSGLLEGADADAIADLLASAASPSFAGQAALRGKGVGDRDAVRAERLRSALGIPGSTREDGSIALEGVV